jgi:predicted permease
VNETISFSSSFFYSSLPFLFLLLLIIIIIIIIIIINLTSPPRQDRYWAHGASYIMGNGGSFPLGIAATA